MTIQLQQDNAFVNSICQQATTLLQADEASQDLSGQWNSLFGGASRLTDLTGSVANGLSKTDMQNAINVLSQLKTWLDEAGQNRRPYLQAVRLSI
jgi:hypothetical protein